MPKFVKNDNWSYGFNLKFNARITKEKKINSDLQNKYKY